MYAIRAKCPVTRRREMANEKFYFCGGKSCFTSFDCPYGTRLKFPPTTYDDCVTKIVIAESGEQVMLEGKIKGVTECPMEEAKLNDAWKKMLKDEDFRKLVRR